MRAPANADTTLVVILERELQTNYHTPSLAISASVSAAVADRLYGDTLPLRYLVLGSVVGLILSLDCPAALASAANRESVSRTPSSQ